MTECATNPELENETRDLHRRTFTAWANGDVEATLYNVADDVIHEINVDGSLVPYAASTTDKAQMRDRLNLMLATFRIGAFVTDHLVIGGHVARSRIKINYIHRATGTRLKTSFRLVVTQQSGLIRHIEEYHDAAYIEAFERLVTKLANE